MMELKLRVPLTKELMNDDLIGYRVTVGLRTENPTKTGVIVGYDDTGMNVNFGNSNIKHIRYEPDHNVLTTYQFDKNVKFCSQTELDYNEKSKSE